MQHRITSYRFQLLRGRHPLQGAGLFYSVVPASLWMNYICFHKVYFIQQLGFFAGSSIVLLSPASSHECNSRPQYCQQIKCLHLCAIHLRSTSVYGSIFSILSQIRGYPFAAARFGQLYAHSFVFRVFGNDNVRHVPRTIEQMVNRPQRGHQFVMENFGTARAVERERQYLAIVPFPALFFDDFPVHLFPGRFT